MIDILGKEIVCFDEALYLKEMGFNGECTGYYHCEEHDDENSYECVGWRGLFRNSFSQYRAAAPSVRAAKLWYTKNKIKPFTENKTTEGKQSYLPRNRPKRRK